MQSAQSRRESKPVPGRAHQLFVHHNDGDRGKDVQRPRESVDGGFAQSHSFPIREIPTNLYSVCSFIQNPKSIRVFARSYAKRSRVVACSSPLPRSRRFFLESRSRVAPLCCRCCCWCSDTWTLWPSISLLWGRITKVSFFWVGPKKKERNYLGFSIVPKTQKHTKGPPSSQKKKSALGKRSEKSSFLKQHHPPKAPLG